MRAVDVPTCAPILGTTVRPDGRRIAVTVRVYDPDADLQRPRLFVHDLDAGTWDRPAGDDACTCPVYAPDGRLAVLRERGAVQDVAVFTDDGVASPPGIPPGAVVLKWWDAPGRLACMGFDADGARRVWSWPDLRRPPVPVTPPRRRVLDYATPHGGRALAWVYGPPRSLGMPPVANTLIVGEVHGEDWAAIELPENPLGYLAWSPDGEHLAVLCRPLDAPLTEPRLWRVHVPSGRSERWTDAPGWIVGYDWDHDGQSLLLAIEQDLDGRLLRLAPDGRTTPVLPDPPARYLSGPHVARDHGRLVLLAQGVDRPQHLAVVEPGEAAARALPAPTPALTDVPLRPAEDVRWTGADGAPLSGLLVRPDGPGPHALVVWLHGGPAEHIQHTFSPYFQALVAAGLAVFAPNVRGSTGRGDAFLQALVGRIGADDVTDVERGVRHLIARGVAHRRRVGLMGWSYGGSLALCVGAHARWARAIVAGAPVADWLTVFGARTWPTLTRHYFPGEPWEAPSAYDAASPSRRLDRLDAPTLLLHGELDDRVPISHARLVFHVLRARGVQADLRLFPGEGHVFQQPWAVREMLERAIGWFDTHLREEG